MSAGRPHAARRAPATVMGRGFGVIRDELLAELGRLGVRQVIISASSCGIAISFEHHRRPYVLTCDRHDRIWKNLYAIGATVEAMCTIKRHGGAQMLEQAFSGFAARPRVPSWWETLGVSPGASVEQVHDAFEQLARTHHPDHGGTSDAMARLRRARSAALQGRAS